MTFDWGDDDVLESISFRVWPKESTIHRYTNLSAPTRTGKKVPVTGMTGCGTWLRASHTGASSSVFVGSNGGRNSPNVCLSSRSLSPPSDWPRNCVCLIDPKSPLSPAVFANSVRFLANWMPERAEIIVAPVSNTSFFLGCTDPARSPATGSGSSCQPASAPLWLSEPFPGVYVGAHLTCHIRYTGSQGLCLPQRVMPSGSGGSPSHVSLSPLDSLDWARLC